jgi:uncharacterized protein
MKEPADAVLLRAFMSEDDKYDGIPLYQAIVLKAREKHLAGATVFRGPIGYGRSNRVPATNMLGLLFALPTVVEIVDTQAHIDEFLPVLDELMPSGIVTLEKVAVMRYRYLEKGRETS